MENFITENMNSNVEFPQTLSGDNDNMTPISMETDDNNFTFINFEQKNNVLEENNQALDKNFTDNKALNEIRFLENSQNLELIKPDVDFISSDEPFSGFRMMGQLASEALDVRNYWYAMEHIGEDIAAYKWAYDEGEMGEFTGAAFAKEMLKSGFRTLNNSTLNLSGQIMTMLGENIEKSPSLGAALVLGPLAASSNAGKTMQQLGNVLKDYSAKINSFDVLMPDADSMNDKPSFSRLANVIGAGSSQVLAMGAIAKILGAGATYGLFASESAGEMFDEALDKTGSVATADALALTNAAITYGIDRIFNPLPHHIAQSAKVTSKEIAEEIIGAPLREAGTEVLQQMLAENLVRKAGFDATQDLFEGLLESALGGFVGSSVLSSGSGAFYFANKHYEKARENLLAKGVSEQELDFAEKGMMHILEQNPEAFQKVLERNFNARIKQLQYEAKAAQEENVKKIKKEAAEGFPKIFDEVYKRVFDVVGDEQKAKIAAGFLSAEAISFYDVNPNITPQKMLDDFLPQFKKMSYAEFLRKTNPQSAISFMFGGKHAKLADLAKLSDAYNMQSAQVDAVDIWHNTGWYFGNDKMARFEISDKNAKVKISKSELFDDINYKHFLSGKNDFEQVKAEIGTYLSNVTKSSNDELYKQFWQYIEANAKQDYSFALQEKSAENVLAEIQKLNAIGDRLKSAHDKRNDDLMYEYLVSSSFEDLRNDFFNNNDFSFMSVRDKQNLLPLLNVEQVLFYMDKRWNEISDYFEQKLLKERGDTQFFFQRHLLDEKGRETTLGELLEHKELFDNYPQLENMPVVFRKLKNHAPYHIYNDADLGNVLEIDLYQLNLANLKEILLKGAAFAVQDIEGFDYTLSDEQRRNFMNREIMMAKKLLSRDLYLQMDKFFKKIPLSVNVSDFVSRYTRVPLPSADLSKSSFVYNDAKSDVLSYFDIDFDAIKKVIDQHFNAKDKKGYNDIYRIALGELQILKDEYFRKVQTMARVHGGYRASWLPWGGLSSQGASDNRMMLRRKDYSDEQRLREPFWEENSTSSELDVLNLDDEYKKRFSTDEKKYREFVKNAALGAYEYGNHIVHLFENADALTIVHECLHYFWDMLQNPILNNNTSVRGFFDAIEPLRHDFFMRYQVKKGRGGYYVYQRSDGELMKELPLGFDTVQEAAEAGVQELFVKKIMEGMNRGTYMEKDVLFALGFYRSFLLSLVKQLNLNSHSVGRDGGKIIKFLRNSRLKPQSED